MISNQDAKRVAWIDCAKGIAILLVIFGHTLTSAGGITEQVLRGCIFSFHMPLFFILSCVTFKLSADGSQFVQKTEKAFRHLVITALILYGLRILINIITHFRSIEWESYLAEKINVLVYGSGVGVNVSDTVIPAFGMMWFLIVLFCGRTLFDYLHLKLNRVKFIMAVCVCTVIGIILGSVQWLPLSLDVAFAVMPFFLFGSYLKSIDLDRKSVLWCIFCLAVWGTTFAFIYCVGNNYMELADRRYPLFPLCYITAIAGTMFVSYFSKLAVKSWGGAKLLGYIGKNSIYLYGVHAMDYVYSFIWSRTGHDIINGIIRVTADVIICVLLMKGFDLLHMKGKALGD